MNWTIPSLSPSEEKQWEAWVKSHRCPQFEQKPFTEVVSSAQYVVCYRPDSIGGSFSLRCDLCGAEEYLHNEEI